jgi:hypothetical protein
MIGTFLKASVTRRLFLGAPVVGPFITAAPKPALPESRREIELVQTFIAGTGYYDAARAMADLAEGQRLTLRRQPGNPHDQKAIEVYSARGSKLGYVPRVDNSALSALLDDGRQLHARITTLRPDNYPSIGMAIALVE